MLKIHFSGEDILRTRVAPAADPVWEVVLSLHLLPGRSRDPLLAGWRREVSRGCVGSWTPRHCDCCRR